MDRRSGILGLDMTTPKRSRFRRILKWVGVGMCSLILGVWFSSSFLAFGYHDYEGIDDGIEAKTWWGCIVCSGEVCAWTRSADFYPSDLESGWYLRRKKRISLGFTLPSFVHQAAGSMNLDVPLWLPFLFFALPTSLLHWRDRRCIPPGCCLSCGYNLTGNVRGICPECGETCDAEASAI